MNINKIVPLLIFLLVLIPIQAKTTLDLYTEITPIINSYATFYLLGTYGIMGFVREQSYFPTSFGILFVILIPI